MLAAGRARRDASGVVAPPAEAETVAALGASIGGLMGAEAFARAARHGRALSPDEAVDYCRAVFGAG